MKYETFKVLKFLSVLPIKGPIITEKVPMRKTELGFSSLAKVGLGDELKRKLSFCPKKMQVLGTHFEAPRRGTLNE